jgi:hypothetical protein
MKPFAKSYLAVILLFFGIYSTATLFAQSSPRFILSGTTVMVRMHGQAEVVGDLKLTCSLAGDFPPNASISVAFSPVFGIVNAADGSHTFSTASAVGFNARVAYIESEPASTAIALGTAFLNDTIHGLTMGISGTAAKGDIIHIMGIRVNIGEANAALNSEVFATIIGAPPNGILIENTNTFPVALVEDEISVQMESVDPPGAQVATIKVIEDFPSALTSVADENDIQRTPAALSAKRAANGTQIQIVILNVLPGVKIDWNASVVGTDSILTLALADPSTTSFTNISPVPVPSVSFVYNVAADDEGSVEEVDIPVTFSLVRIPYPYISGEMFAQVRLGPNAGTHFSSTIPSSDILSFANNPVLGDDPPASNQGVFKSPSGSSSTRSESVGERRENPRIR